MIWSELHGDMQKRWLNSTAITKCFHPNLTGVGTSSEKTYFFHRDAIGSAFDTGEGLTTAIGVDDEQDYSFIVRLFADWNEKQYMRVVDGAAGEPMDWPLRVSFEGVLAGWAILALNDPQLLEQRQEDLERIVEVSQAQLPERFTYAAELATPFARDREPVRELLYLWLRWWRDLLLVKEGAEEYLHNQDQLQQLHLQAAGLDSVQVVAFVKLLLRTLEALDSNANPRLALEVLMLNLPLARISV